MEKSSSWFYIVERVEDNFSFTVCNSTESSKYHAFMETNKQGIVHRGTLPFQKIPREKILKRSILWYLCKLKKILL